MPSGEIAYYKPNFPLLIAVSERQITSVWRNLSGTLVIISHNPVRAREDLSETATHGYRVRLPGDLDSAEPVHCGGRSP